MSLYGGGRSSCITEDYYYYCYYQTRNEHTVDIGNQGKLPRYLHTNLRCICGKADSLLALIGRASTIEVQY